MIRFGWLGIFALSLTLGTAGCGDGGSGGDAGNSNSGSRIHGAGATFPAPLYKRWVTEYDTVADGVTIDYEAIGSGGGVKSISDKTVDFGASDAPLNTEEINRMGGVDAVVEFPTVAGSVVMVFNVPGVDALKLTGELIADIYLGKVAKWNDPRLVELNPDADLPNLPISPVWRTDGSGTTYVFTKYLSTQSDPFKHNVGSGKAVSFNDVGKGGKGNPGVTAVVAQTAGSIGYVEYNFATQTDLPSAAVQNRAGKFVMSSPESVAAAGAGAASRLSGKQLAADIWNQPGDGAYPIAAFTYMIVYADLHNLPDKQTAQNLVDFFWWITHDGQGIAASMDYAPLAPAVQAKVEAVLKSLTYKGQALTIGPAAAAATQAAQAAP